MDEIDRTTGAQATDERQWRLGATPPGQWRAFLERSCEPHVVSRRLTPRVAEETRRARLRRLTDWLNAA